MAQEIVAQDQVIDIMLHTGTCTLEDIARRCPNLTWNQVFLVVDHLSRTGQARLMPAKEGRYTLTLLHRQNGRPDRHSLPT